MPDQEIEREDEKPVSPTMRELATALFR